MSYPSPFGKYLLLDRINVGGMAEVFKAKSFGVEGFQRILAIKRILPNMADDDEFINMFVDEARIAVQLSHPNIVQIYELGRYETQYYIAMEYVSGKDLRQVFDRYRKQERIIPLPAAAFIASKICEGLDYAHRKKDPAGRPLNLIHRDVSPQNILVSFEGGVKITDFGIAKAEDRASKTQAGVLKGKFGYMSPEQVRGLEIDHRSDVFAVGILLYEMVTGNRLFVGESDFSTLEKVRKAEVKPPTEFNKEISPELEAVILKALARDREARYQWCSEFHDDLQQFLITDNTIFNGKKLSELLAADYATEIEDERKKMEEFMQISTPPPEVAAAAESPLSRASAFPGAAEWAGAEGGGKGEKTMIFESGFGELPASSSAETRIGSNLLTPAAPGAAAPAAAPAQKTAATPTAQTPPPSSRRHVIALGVMSGLLVALVGVLAWLLLKDHGRAIIVQSSVPGAQVYLDDELIGTTPLEYPDVPFGMHHIRAIAPGYNAKTYQFELRPGQGPAQLEIPLEAARVEKATLEIVSEPSGASVHIAGLPQGVTPLTLQGQDPSRPIILEVSKAGYISEVVSVVFKPGERTHVARVFLKSNTPAPQPMAGITTAPVGAAEATLRVDSQPPGASIVLDNESVGVTPLEIAGLKVGQSYSLVLQKNGFRPHTETLTIDTAGVSTLKVSLVAGKGGKMLPRLTPKESQARITGGGGREPGEHKAPAKEPKEAAPKHKKRGDCNGSDAKISVVAQGIGDCRVTVGDTSLGIAPIFRKPAPVGRCMIEVKCPDGKSYTATKQLTAGSEEKIIIRSGDWN